MTAGFRHRRNDLGAQLIGEIGQIPVRHLAQVRWPGHPIKRLRDAGVKVTVSTDDPPFFHTTMTREYEMLAQTFGWDAADFAALNRVALEAAFCDAETRAGVARKLEAA